MKAGYDRALEYCDMQKLGEISSSGSTHPYTEYEEWKEMEEYLRRLREQQRKTEQRNRTTKQVWAGIFASPSSLPVLPALNKLFKKNVCPAGSCFS